MIERNAQEGVTWITSFVSEGKDRTFCVNDAPAPEAIRRTADRNELPVDEITQVRVLDHYFYAWQAGRREPGFSHAGTVNTVAHTKE